MQVLDRDELELPFDGPTIFHDIEGDEELFAEPWAFRRSYQKAMNDFLDGVRARVRQPRLRPRAVPHRRAAGRVAQLLPALPRRRPARRSRVRVRDLNHDDLSEPTPDLGNAAGRDPPHHPPAEPPPVPPRGMGADALPQADHPAQPAADPARAAACCLLLRIALLVLLFFFLARPVLNPTGLEQWLGTRRPVQPGRLDRRLAEHGLRRRRGGGISARAASRRPALLAVGPPAGPLHARDHLGAPRSGAPRGRRDRAATSSRPPSRPLPLTATHAAWPAVLEGVDEVLRSCTYPTRQLTIITDLRKSRLGPRRRRDRPALERAGRPRADRRRRRRRGRQRRRSQALVAARPDDPRRRRQPLGGGDPQRLAAHARRRQGDPARR